LVGGKTHSQEKVGRPASPQRACMSHFSARLGVPEGTEFEEIATLDATRNRSQ